MKKFTLAILLLTSVISYAQTDLKKSEIKTTYEEYNFLTERYAYDDNVKMLDGYEFKPFMDKTVDKFNYNYKLFVESKTQKIKAIFITITKRKKKKEKREYLCMPINNEELFIKFNRKAKKIGISMSMGFDELNKMLVSQFIDNQYNSN